MPTASARKQYEEALIAFNQLKAEFDLYFVGQRKIPPLPEREALAKVIKRIQFMPVRDNAVKFKISNLVARFNSYNEMWNRRLKEIEEGPRRRPKVAVPPATAQRITNNGGVVIHNPEVEVSKLKALYHRYISQVEAVTGRASRLGYEDFKTKMSQRLIAFKRKTHCQALQIDIKKKEGKVKMVIKPIKEEM